MTPLASVRQELSFPKIISDRLMMLSVEAWDGNDVADLQ
jgi:hypothetical protein